MSDENMNPSEPVVSEPEMVESANSTPDASQDDALSESNPDAPSENVEPAPEEAEEAPPEGHSFVPVQRETVAQVAERLHKPVNVITDANPDVTNKETGEVTADRLVVPNETTA